MLGNGIHCTQVAGLTPGIPEPLDRQLGESLRDAFATVLGMCEYVSVAAQFTRFTMSCMPDSADDRVIDSADDERVGERRVGGSGQKALKEAIDASPP